MSGSIGAFIDARLDDDQRYARIILDAAKRKAENATPQDMADAAGILITALSDPLMTGELEKWMSSAVPVPNDLNRVLHEIDVKRRILARHRDQGDDSPELRDLASIWRRHPDYKQGWKP